MVRGWPKRKVITEWNLGVITSFKLRKVRKVVYKMVIEVAKKVNKKCTGKDGIFSPILDQGGGRCKADQLGRGRYPLLKVDQNP